MARSSRFATPLTENEIKRLEHRQVPKQTRKSTEWAVRPFNQWAEECNKALTVNKCPTDLLH